MSMRDRSLTNSDIDEENRPRRLGLLLIDGFALMSYASVIEPYRAANILAGRELYSWWHFSVDGKPVHASNGATIAADHPVGTPLDCDALFVFAGGDPAGFDDVRTFAWLRRIAAGGTMIAGVSAGPYLLAKAGLLESHRATIHWEHRTAFEEAFPLIALERGLFCIDRRRVTCAGGLAGMDLALELIERERGHGLAARVSDWFIRSEPRDAQRPQRLGLRERYDVANDRVLRVLGQMEANVEDPCDRELLAQIAGVSPRQLERLFAVHLGETVRACYQRIRLEQAEQLLRSTGLSVTEIGVACGFKSTAHFSRSYKARYSRAPSDARPRAGRSGTRAFSG